MLTASGSKHSHNVALAWGEEGVHDFPSYHKLFYVTKTGNAEYNSAAMCKQSMQTRIEWHKLVFLPEIMNIIFKNFICFYFKIFSGFLPHQKSGQTGQKDRTGQTDGLDRTGKTGKTRPDWTHWTWWMARIDGLMDEWMDSFAYSLLLCACRQE